MRDSHSDKSDGNVPGLHKPPWLTNSLGGTERRTFCCSCFCQGGEGKIGSAPELTGTLPGVPRGVVSGSFIS